LIRGFEDAGWARARVPERLIDRGQEERRWQREHEAKTQEPSDAIEMLRCDEQDDSMMYSDDEVEEELGESKKEEDEQGEEIEEEVEDGDEESEARDSTEEGRAGEKEASNRAAIFGDAVHLALSLTDHLRGSNQPSASEAKQSCVQNKFLQGLPFGSRAAFWQQTCAFPTIEPIGETVESAQTKVSAEELPSESMLQKKELNEMLQKHSSDTTNLELRTRHALDGSAAKERRAQRTHDDSIIREETENQMREALDLIRDALAATLEVDDPAEEGMVGEQEQESWKGAVEEIGS
jgi:hypothetical protein